MMSVMVQRDVGTSPAPTRDDLLGAAIAASSIAVAVCDDDFSLCFFNEALGRLIGARGTARESSPLHGAALLQALGVGDIAAIMAMLAAQGAWHGVTRGAGDGDVHLAVERFGDADGSAGWLVTARALAGPTVVMAADGSDLLTLSDKLSPREREVMRALQDGATNKAIAQSLKISPRTVEFHRARIMKRFGATSLIDLVRKVAEETRARCEAAACVSRPATAA